jgi:hypothetical protein
LKLVEVLNVYKISKMWCGSLSFIT